MPIFISILAGMGLTWILKESEMAIPVFIAYWVFVILLFAWPAGAGYFLTLLLTLGVMAVTAAFWAELAGIALGVFMFVMLILGLLTAMR
jgi:hypothetical protein